MAPKKCLSIDIKDLLDIEKSFITESITVGSSVMLSDDSDENYIKIYVYTDNNGKLSWVFKERVLKEREQTEEKNIKSQQPLKQKQTKSKTKDPDKMRKNAKDLRPFVENIIKIFKEEKDIEVGIKRLQLFLTDFNEALSNVRNKPTKKTDYNIFISEAMKNMGGTNFTSKERMAEAVKMWKAKAKAKAKSLLDA